MKMTDLSIEWDDDGAVVTYKTSRDAPFWCPRCGQVIAPNTEHRCGNRTVAAKKADKRSATAKK